MANEKTPVVWDDDAKKHRPLGSGEKMGGLSASSMISSDSGNLLQQGSDGLMLVAGSSLADPRADNLLEESSGGKLQVTVDRIVEWLDGHPQDAAAIAAEIPVVSEDSGNIVSAGSDGGAFLNAEGAASAVESVLLSSGGVGESLAAAVAGAISGSGADLGGAGSPASGTDVLRSFSGRFADILNVKDFGAKGDGSTDDTAAVQAMIDAAGYAFFLAGDYRCGTATFDAPLKFGPGAALSADSGATVTITGRIDAPRQQIFKGDGTFLLTQDSDSGEDGRMVHASWFGCVPTSDAKPAETTAALQKAVDSLGSLREGIVEFDSGRYYLTGTVTVGRGVWIKGAGIRRTIFWASSDGWPMFVTGETACRFTGIQAECDPSSITKRTSPFIQLNHEWCRVQEICVNAQPAVEINGINCTVEDVWAVSGKNLGAGSALVKIKAIGATVKNVYGFQSAYGPENMVCVDSSAGAVREVLVENIYNMMPARSVALITGGNLIGNTIIRNIRSTPYSEIDAAVVVENKTNAIISAVQIDGVIAFSNVQNVISIEQNNSSATTKNVAINNVSNNGRVFGLSIANTSGTMSDVIIGDCVDVRSATTPVAVSGTISNLHISSNAQQNTAPVLTKDITINDDAVYIIETPQFLSAVFIISSYASYFGMYAIRTVDGNHVITALQESSQVEHATVNTVLTGTTGNDNVMTVSVANRKIYIENRLGDQAGVSYTIMSGKTMGA